MTFETYLQRQRVVRGLIERGIWQNIQVRRLINGVYGDEEECNEFLQHASHEEIEALLVDEGVDLEELRKKFEVQMSRIRAMFPG